MNKTLIALLGLIIVFADGASAKSHPQFKVYNIILQYIKWNIYDLSVDIIIQSLSAVSVESSTDDVTTSEWTETTSSTSPTINWETSSIGGETDVINPSTATDVPNICQQSNSSTDYIFPNPEDCTTFYMCSNGLPYLYVSYIYNHLFLYSKISNKFFKYFKFHIHRTVLVDWFTMTSFISVTMRITCRLANN